MKPERSGDQFITVSCLYALGGKLVQVSAGKFSNCTRTFTDLWRHWAMRMGRRGLVNIGISGTVIVAWVVALNIFHAFATPWDMVDAGLLMGAEQE